MTTPRTPVIPALAPVIPAPTPVIPALAPVIPAPTHVIPAKAGILSLGMDSTHRLESPSPEPHANTSNGTRSTVRRLDAGSSYPS